PRAHHGVPKRKQPGRLRHRIVDERHSRRGRSGVPPRPEGYHAQAGRDGDVAPTNHGRIGHVHGKAGRDGDLAPTITRENRARAAEKFAWSYPQMVKSWQSFVTQHIESKSLAT